MAKKTYLELTNTVLKRISLNEITDVTTATGQALIITELINEAQNELWTEENWYSLYKIKSWTTDLYTAATISFADTGPDTILDSANGFGDFSSGQTVVVGGSTSNDGVYLVETVAAGTLTLQDTDSLTVEAAGESVTITAMTYPVPSDWGRTIDIVDVSNNNLLVEDYVKTMDQIDPDTSSTGSPNILALEGAFYRLQPVPAAEYKITERYWQLPDTLTANGDTSDLPIECENAIIHWAWFSINEYLNKFETADRVRSTYNKMVTKAKIQNGKMIDKMNVMNSASSYRGSGLRPAPFPPGYPGYR